MAPSGRIATALASALALAGSANAQQAAKGEEAFQDHCSQCHVLSGVGQGPSLIGIVGRKAASLPNYPYSDALKRSGITWTAASLDTFIANPTKLVPGTAMRAIVADTSERRDLIAYLATLKR